jgi:hypothetical protein
MQTLFAPAHLIIFAVLGFLFLYIPKLKVIKIAVLLLILGIYAWGCKYKRPSEKAAAAQPTAVAAVPKATDPPTVVPGMIDWRALTPPKFRPPLHPVAKPSPIVKAPYVPAEKCGGMSSWDRQYWNMGVPVPCPSPG